MILLDTDILIEIQRHRPEALAWVESLAGTESAIPAAVAFEMMVGAQNQRHLDQAAALVDGFQVVALTAEDSTRTLDLIRQHVLTTGLGLGDYLIASQALNRQATLYTFNLKHFSAIAGLDARAPYNR